ncbi:hypothetical protein NDU88_005757, partial [Pleurodeles waltl]
LKPLHEKFTMLLCVLESEGKSSKLQTRRHDFDCWQQQRRRPENALERGRGGRESGGAHAEPPQSLRLRRRPYEDTNCPLQRQPPHVPLGSRRRSRGERRRQGSQERKEGKGRVFRFQPRCAPGVSVGQEATIMGSWVFQCPATVTLYPEPVAMLAMKIVAVPRISVLDQSGAEVLYWTVQP